MAILITLLQTPEAVVVEVIIN